ncbi:MAG: hypothetical protein NC548_55815 [Lachnospiraceae bacterium]|nr:hypothetical protein [Lachnospiraceae bacterium]
MGSSKYIGQNINGFLIIDSYSKKSASGKYNGYFSVQCNVCKKFTERARNNVLTGEATCECQYVFKYHNAAGLSNTRLNKIYRMMLDRCNNPNSTAYRYYGGKGIRVCTEWENDFESFYKWAMSNGYADNLTIERLKIDENYQPENCTWIPLSEQAKNSRQCHYQIIDGKRSCLAEIARKYSIPYGTIKDRYARGKRGNKLISKQEE